MKKLTGETKLLLIMGLIVLLGGGFLAFAPQNGGSDKPPEGPTSAPEPTPRPLTKEEFEKVFQAAGAHVEGPAGADLAVIEFGDVECVSCRYSYDKFGRKFGKGISAQFSFHHFPLDIHPMGKPCALALEAADKQGKFWPLYAALFDDPKAVLTEEFLKDMAASVGLDLAKFEADRKSAETAKRVEADIKLGGDLHVNRTPTFFVLNRKDGKVQAAVGPREFMKFYQGIPGVPAPEPENKP